MDNQNRNLILATVLSALVIFAWTYLFPPQPPAPIEDTTTAAQTAASDQVASPTLTTPAATETVAPVATAADAVADAPRIKIDTPALTGSISLAGGRFYDLSLKNYKETLNF